jgi:hypothetical protein
LPATDDLPARPIKRQQGFDHGLGLRTPIDIVSEKYQMIVQGNNFCICADLFTKEFQQIVATMYVADGERAHTVWHARGDEPAGPASD